MKVMVMMMWRMRNALKNFCPRSEIKLVYFFQEIDALEQELEKNLSLDTCSPEGKDGKAPESDAITQNLQQDTANHYCSVNDKYTQKLSTK